MKKRFVAFGILAVFLISAFVYAGPFSFQDREFKQFRGKGFGQGAPTAPIRHGMDNMGFGLGSREELLNELGLPEDADREQIIEALGQKREEVQEQQLLEVKEKLGLPSNATEEVQSALEEWREENKLLIGFRFFNKRGLVGCMGEPLE